MRTHLLTLLFVSALASPAMAQPTATASNWTFGGAAGYGRTWDDEGSIGNGWLLGGYVDRRLSKNVDLDLAIDVVKNSRDDNFVANGHTTYVSAQVIRRFGSRQANGFVMGGGTLGFYSGETGFSDGSFRSKRSSTNPGWIFGGGFSFRTATGVEIAPIVRITLMQIDTDSDPWSSITYGIRVGFER